MDEWYRHTGFEVHTYQVNVPLGDCAIHLLVSNAPRYYVPPNTQNGHLPKNRTVVSSAEVGKDGKRYGLIHRAILFDGGHDNNGAGYSGAIASERISSVVQEIEKYYCFAEEYLTDSAKNDLSTPSRHQGQDYKSQLMFDAIVITHWDRDHYCGSLQMIHDDLITRWDETNHPVSSYLKYNNNQACISTLYCPAWLRGRANMAKGSPAIFYSKLDGGRAKMHLTRQWNSPLNFKSKAIQKTAWGSSGYLFKVVSGQKNLIGIDLFAGINVYPDDSPVNVRWRDVDTTLGQVCEMYRQNPNRTVPHRPIFLIIGACGYVFRRKDPVPRPKKECTWDNYVSISAITVWDESDELRISHMCGGDAHVVTEDAVRPFLTNKGNNVPIEVWKAAHHGSRTSTSVPLLKQGSPQKYIISAGSAHGHPSWLTISVLFSFYRGQTNTPRFRQKEKPLYNMRFPYYITASNQTNKSVSENPRNVNLEAYRNHAKDWDKAFETASGKDSSPPVDLTQFKQEFMANSGEYPTFDQYADYLYRCHHVHKAIPALFHLFAEDPRYKQAKQDSPDGQPQSEELKKVLREHRVCLIRFLRQFWLELSDVWAEYIEYGQQIRFLRYVALFGSADPNYDGRAQPIGTLSAILESFHYRPARIISIGERLKQAVPAFMTAQLGNVPQDLDVQPPNESEPEYDASKLRPVKSVTVPDDGTDMSDDGEAEEDFEDDEIIEDDYIGVPDQEAPPFFTPSLAPTEEPAFQLMEKTVELEEVDVVTQKDVESVAESLKEALPESKPPTESRLSTPPGVETGVKKGLVKKKPEAIPAIKDTKDTIIITAKPAQSPAPNKYSLARDSAGQRFVLCTGPLSVKSLGNKDFRNTVLLSDTDVTLRYFQDAWGPPDEDKAITSYVRKIQVQLDGPENPKNQTVLDLKGVKLYLAKNADAKPLLFTTSSQMLSRQFEPPSTTGVAADLPSGLDKFPGHVIMALEHQVSTTGGFESLADWFSLVGHSAQPWMRAILESIKVEIPKEAAKSSRNAIWYLPGQQHVSALRLEGSILFDGTVKSLSNLGLYLSNWEIGNFSVIAKKILRPAPTPGDDKGHYDVTSSVTLAAELDVGKTKKSLGIYVSLLDNGFTINVASYAKDVDWAMIKKWVADHCTDGPDMAKLEGDLASLKGTEPKPSESVVGSSTADDGVFWRKLTISVANEKITGISIFLEASMPYLVPDGQHAVFDLQFSWSPGMVEFHGEFLGKRRKPPADTPALQYVIGHERWKQLKPLVTSHEVMSLRYINRKEPIAANKIPFGLPTEIAACELTVSNRATRFKGSLVSAISNEDRTKIKSDVPVLRLDSVELNLLLDVDYSSKPTKTRLELEGLIGLKPHREELGLVMLRASILYDNGAGKWALSANASNIYMSSLYSLFGNGGEQEGVMQMLGDIRLSDFSIEYSRQGDQTSTITFGADLDIGGIMAGVKFSRTSSTEWEFSASVSKDQATQATQKEALTIRDAVESLLGSSFAEDLPDFVLATELPFTGASDDKIEVVCKREAGSANLVFLAELELGKFHIDFAQISPQKVEEKEVVVKRLVRVSMGGLPSPPPIPVVGQVELPFEALEFLWLGSTLSSEDLKLLNRTLPSSRALAAPVGQEELIKGHHLRLVDGSEVILDHVFLAKTGNTDVPPPAGESEEPLKSTGEVKETSGSPSASATMAPLKRKKAGLSISGLGISFENRMIQLHLDAVLDIGPMTAGIRGLNVSLDIQSAKGLHGLLAAHMTASISGFDLTFDRSPMLLSGALIHQKRGNTEIFSGGMAISLKEITVGAVGLYQKEDTYDSFFAYAMVEGTLFTIGWAEIKGLIAGFGYNSRLNLPSVGELLEFPLLSGFQEGNGDSITHTPNKWITTSLGSLWIAAGVLVRAFQSLDVRAVATLSLGPDQLELALLARAVASIPRGSPRDKALMVIDMSLIGKMDLMHGEFAVDGAINPMSFILNQNCRPSGGFAVRSWFGDRNPNKGDWVVTFGGYHPSFQVPAHYPTPPRLRIDWKVSSMVQVVGEAYVAVTPGVVMAGGLLHATFDGLGVHAYFDAHADFIVNLKPLYYEAELAVCAGVSYEIRFWFVSVKISVEVGAMLQLYGPPLGGIAHFKVGPISFDVAFGEKKSSSSSAALSLSEFLQLVHEQSDDGNERNDTHVLCLTHGRLPDKALGASMDASSNSKSDDAWVVSCDDFSFKIRSCVPITAITSRNNSSITPLESQKILSRPMKMKQSTAETRNLKSEVSVAVHRKPDADGNGAQEVDMMLIEPLEESLPSKLWGEYPENPSDVLRPDLLPPTTKQLVGITVRSPMGHAPETSIVMPPTVAPEPIPSQDVRPETDNLDYNTRPEEIRERMQWATLKASMGPGNSKISRDSVLGAFLDLAIGGTDDGKEGDLRKAYRLISSERPRVVMGEPERFYRNPPMVWSR
ncbi:hypothetical protein QQX98_002897 [Neonectria punicea]|uniref:DUF6603 domain-containing protein n=1 Tax=Neonectria punicea TaxID=979145 RepID=A0ABR1HHB8_9HYPO